MNLLKHAATGAAVEVNGRQAHVLRIAPTGPAREEVREVGQLETDRETVLRGMRAGALAVFERFGGLVARDGGGILQAHSRATTFSPGELVDMVLPMSILERRVDPPLPSTARGWRERGGDESSDLRSMDRGALI